MSFERIAVVGAGAWGSALANVIGTSGLPSVSTCAWLRTLDTWTMLNMFLNSPEISMVRPPPMGRDFVSFFRLRSR